MIFFIFKGFPQSRKNWRFWWPRTCQKSQFFATFPILLIFHPNGWMFTFELSCGHLVMIFIILEGFPEIPKNWRFRPPRPCWKMVNFAILTSLHISPPNQKNFYILVVLWSTRDDFHHFQKLPESRKDVSDDHGPVEKANFFVTFPILHITHWNSEFLNLSCPVVIWWWFSSFWKAFQTVEKKIEFSTTPALSKNGQFCYFHIFAYFSSKTVKFYSLVVLWSTSDDFHHFQRLSRKSKKLKFSKTVDLLEKSIFAISLSLHISHPNEWIHIL